MPPRMKAQKDPFAAIPEEFRDTASNMDETGIRRLIAQTTLNNEELREAQENDEDLQSQKESLKIAQEPYREGFKMNRLKIRFLKQVLEDKGKPTGEVSQTTSA